MKTQKPKRSKWFSLVVGGIAFMVLAGTAAEARKFVTDYHANPSGYVVAVNQKTNKMMLIQKFKDITKQQRKELTQRNHLNITSPKSDYIFRAKTIKKEGKVYLEMRLEKRGKIIDSIVSPITSTQWPHTPNNQCTPGVGPKQCATIAWCQEGAKCHKTNITDVPVTHHQTVCTLTGKWYCEGPNS